jgi:hypothetical protein
LSPQIVAWVSHLGVEIYGLRVWYTARGGRSDRYNAWTTPVTLTRLAIMPFIEDSYYRAEESYDRGVSGLGSGT